MPIYIALTGAYAADKEIRRWAGNPEPPRKGSVFVYLWLLFYLVAFLIRAFRPEFALPEELGRVAKILDMIKTQGQVTNREVADSLQVSPASAKRILTDLASRGQIQAKGV